ncbi:MAG TPA: hypothetical protein VF334_16100 [Polyangia bacterium]
MSDEEQADDNLDDDARARRAEPERCFYEVLREFMTNNDVPGFLALWRGRCQSFRLLADDVMYCFDRVVDHPPADLIEEYKKATGYVLNHVTPTKITPYSYDDYVKYVADLRDQMRAIYDATQP